jgi:hypothetical protein
VNSVNEVVGRIAGVCERDIDLLLLEEFLSTPEFVGWFLGQSGIPTLRADHFESARRSVTHTTGESDLELHFVDGGGVRCVVLIENKIGAQLQPLQAERYIARGNHYIKIGLCQIFYTVIVAPDVYFSGIEQTKGFQYRLSYNRIVDWFESAESLGPRRHYKVSMLRSALDKATLGYQPVLDDAVTDFFSDYWDIATSVHPELGMRRTRKERPGGSGRVYFKTLGLSAINCDIAHKTPRGIVDLHLRGRGDRLAMVESSLQGVLEPGMSIQSAAKSAAVRLIVPVLDRQSPAAQQADAIKSGLYAAKRLAVWAESNASLIASI